MTAVATRPLNARQQLFVSAYLADKTRDATAAARAAGYAERGLKVQAFRLLQNKAVAAVIGAQLAKIHKRYEISADRVARELATIAFSSVDDFVVGEDGALTLKDPEKRRAMRAVSSIKRKTRTRVEDNDTITEYELEYRLWPKVEALGLLAKHLGMIKPDSTNVQVNVGIQQAQVWTMEDGKELVFPPVLPP